jgi:thiamine monophosphate synthase
MPLAYYITDRQSCSSPILQQIQQAIDASVDLIQIRERDLATRPLLELACRALELAKGSQSKILINDRVDIALAGRLGEFHHSVEIGTVRKQLGEMSEDWCVGPFLMSFYSRLPKARACNPAIFNATVGVWPAPWP